MTEPTVIILAGGQGKRMDLLCNHRPKPILPFAGRFRIIDFSLSNIVHSGLRNVLVLADYMRRSLREYLSNGAPWGLDEHGRLKVLEPATGSYKGTADAVYQSLSCINKCSTAPVLILAADHVYKMDYRKMIAFHESSGADVTVAVTPVPIEEANRFGLASVDHENRIRRFVEKPRVPQGSLASMGIYVFRRDVLVKRLTEDARDDASPHDFGHAIIPRMVLLDKAFAYQFKGYWQDIGAIKSYYQANMALTADSPAFSLEGNWPIFTRDDAPDTDVTPNQAKNSLISPGCLVEGQVENSVISQGVWVGPGAVVKDSVIMAHCMVNRHSVIDRCILDERVTVGESSYLGFGSGPISENCDITVVGKGVTIPSGTILGRGCKVLPGTSPADFAILAVPSGRVLRPS